MHLHQEILEAANEIASSTKDGIFGVDEVVRALPHLNENSVRTHVVSRCCVNAPKNHPHKWDYFRRVGRGKYKVMPRYKAARKATTEPEETASQPLRKERGATSREGRDAIHAVIQRDETVYFAECMELAVVTQGDTLDEVIENLQQAVALHLEGEDMSALGLKDHPRLQILYDVVLAS